MERHLCIRKEIEVGSGGFGSEEVSEWWFWEVLCEGEGSGSVGGWWVQWEGGGYRNVCKCNGRVS